ncbi:hypothetical protein L7F22_020453 [Adiantum nelumboides]|nr:hypothetical protein [Adiantum nelumboides]
MAAMVSPVSNADLDPASLRQQDCAVSSGSTPQDSLLFLGFNQDHGRFACGNALGFRVYDCYPFKRASCRESSDHEGPGGIAIVELLFRSHVLALVGGGPTPRYSPNKVMIWDDHRSCCIGELSFRSQVRSVKLRRDRIVVALEHKIYVYNFADLKLLLQIDTYANPKGLCAISSASNCVVLASPSLIKGQVRLDQHGTKKPKVIFAHDSCLAYLALTLDGRLLATASSKGTLIRVFNTCDCTLLQEVRRGVDRADILSLSLSNDARWLAVSSDRGTIHVFSLKEETEKGEDKISKKQDWSSALNDCRARKDTASSGTNTNPGSTLSFMKGVLPRYFSSEWSFCQFRLPEETKSIVAFGPEQHSIIIVGSDGSFYRCTFDPVGGKMMQQEHVNFMKPTT